jgi:ribonuclease BN (tRNA processing enzyme)
VSVRVRFVGSGDAFGSGGRFQTCILVEAPELTVAIDFGASSLIALQQQGISHNAIDAILLTHLHGDHCGGVPFLLIDAMLGAKRTAPLTVAGPRETRARLEAVREALFPGSEIMVPKFAYAVVELPLLQPSQLRGMTVTAYPAIHTGATNPTSLRVEVAGKVIAYTGDSEWTGHMPELARDADLFIAECYFHAKPVPFHLNYPALKQNLATLGAKRLILTHMGPEMLAVADSLPEDCARDGLVVDL